MFTKAILEKIESLPEGEPFKSTMFFEISTNTAIRQALSRLVKSGQLMRVARGVYVKPEMSRYVGPVPPSSRKIIKLMAEGEKITITGAEAAQRLGLSTQMVLKEVYLTSGCTRIIRLENGGIISLRHASPRKLALAGSLAGIALSALWWMGKEEVTSEVIHLIRQKLSPEEFRVLKEASPLMPAWMSEKILNERKESIVGRTIS